MLGMTPDVASLPMIAAADQGLFNKEVFKSRVSIKVLAQEDLFDALAMGVVDVGAASLCSVVRLRSRYPNIRFVLPLATYEVPTSIWGTKSYLTLGDERAKHTSEQEAFIAFVNQFRGKTIYVEDSEAAWLFVRRVLTAGKVGESDVRLEKVGPSETAPELFVAKHSEELVELLAAEDYKSCQSYGVISSLRTVDTEKDQLAVLGHALLGVSNDGAPVLKSDAFSSTLGPEFRDEPVKRAANYHWFRSIEEIEKEILDSKGADFWESEIKGCTGMGEEKTPSAGPVSVYDVKRIVSEMKQQL